MQYLSDNIVLSTLVLCLSGLTILHIADSLCCKMCWISIDVYDILSHLNHVALLRGKTFIIVADPWLCSGLIDSEFNSLFPRAGNYQLVAELWFVLNYKRACITSRSNNKYHGVLFW